MSIFKDRKRQNTLSSFNVTDFGAAGDGKVDDSKAINAAISAADEVGGGIAFFPKGTYKCMAVKPKSRVTLRGLGWGKSVLVGFNDGSDHGIVDGTGDFSEKNPLTEFNMYDLELGFRLGKIGSCWVQRRQRPWNRRRHGRFFREKSVDRIQHVRFGVGRCKNEPFRIQFWSQGNRQSMDKKQHL